MVLQDFKDKNHNKPRLTRLSIGLILLISILTIFTKHIYALKPVVLDEKVGKYCIGLHLEILEDKEKKWTIEDVTKEPLSSKFKQSTEKNPNFGFSKSAFWLRFKVQILEGNESQWYIDLDLPLLDLIDLYIPEGNGHFKIKKGGDTFPFDKRDIEYRNITFQINDWVGEYIYYIRVESTSIMFFPINILSNNALIDEITFTNSLLIFLYGTLFILIVMNIFFGVFSRDLTSLLYAMFLISISINNLILDGTGFQFFWRNTLWMNDGIPFWSFNAILFLGLFTRIFINTRDNVPVLDKLILIMVITSSIGALSSFIVPFRTIMEIGFYILLSSTIIALLSASVCALKRIRDAYVFLTIFSIFLIFGFIFIITRAGYLPSSLFTEWSSRIGLMSQAILFTFAIADKFKKAQKEKLEIQIQATETLEEKVEERTHELKKTNEKLKGIGKNLKRYLPVQLVNSIIEGEKEAVLETERRKLTIFFSDIKGFTQTTDSMEAEELSSLLNEYLTEMTKVAHKWGGTVDKFVGDAIMIFFGAPEATDDKDHALRCVNMAIEMQGKMKELQDKWYHEGIENPLAIRIGITTGTATVGNFGAEERLSYTVIGGQVNLASRLESLCEPGGILISHPTWAMVSDEIECKQREDKVKVKGISRDVIVYEVVV